MANLRVTPAWQRANFSTQAQFPTIAKFFRSFHLRYRINPVAQALSTWHKTMCFMHRPAHYWLNISGKISFRGHKRNFDTRQAEKSARHVRNVTENIFLTSHEIFLLSDREKNIGTKYNE